MRKPELGLWWMCKLPVVTGHDAIKAFQRAGFEVARTAGSHHILCKTGHVFLLTVPVHGRKALTRGTLRRLIRDSGLSVAEFNELLTR